jgi:hypothetical protein
MKKFLSYITFLLIILLLLTSCDPICESNPEVSYENWISVLDLDGSVETYLQEGGGSCFFVPNPEELDEELALIVSRGNIYTMTLSGELLNDLFSTDEGYEIDFRWINISHNKSKIVLKYRYNLFLINISDSSNVQLTYTEENIYGIPSFSLDDNKIIYSKINSELRCLIELDIETLSEQELMCNEEFVISKSRYISEDLIIGKTYYYNNQEEGSLIIYNTVSGEINQISSDTSDLFDITIENGNCAYLNESKDSLLLFNVNTLTTIGEIQFEYPIQKYPIFNSEGNKLILGNFLIDTYTLQTMILDLLLIDTWGNHYNLTFNDNGTKLIGTIKSDIARGEHDE